MPTTLDEPRAPGHPIVKRTAIGQRFIGALVRFEQRPALKTDRTPDLKDDGSPRHELVLTLMTMPGTTAPVGIGGVNHQPQPGELVRMILKGGGFGQWIEARKNHGDLQTGDVVEQHTEYGQAFTGKGAPAGPKLYTNDELNAVPRGTSVGVYGPLTLRKPRPDETEWVDRADRAYHESKPRTTLEPVTAGERTWDRTAVGGGGGAGGYSSQAPGGYGAGVAQQPGGIPGERRYTDEAPF